MANLIRTGGGGSGGSATLITKSITQNGTYLATDDNADGYSEVTVDVVGGGEVVTQFRYIKWQITANGGQSHMQMSEFGFKDSNGNIMTLPSGYSASSSLPTVSANEGVDRLFDGSTDTKMTMSFPSGSVEDIVIDFGSGNSIDITEYPYYYWCSGVDDSQYVGRNPQSWKIYGANTSDFSDGVLLDEVAYITQTRVNKAVIYQGLMVSPVQGGGTPIITDLISTPTTSASTEPFADSYYSSEQVDMRPWCAFDKTLENYWASADGTNHYIGYKFASAVVVNRISMQLRIDDPSFSLGQAPIRWVVEGSNDDGTTWETVNESGYYWASYQDSHIYDFENTTAYKWWRVRATRVQNGQRIFGLAELGFYNVSYVNMVEFKNYLKFNGEGIILPWTINSDYKFEVTFYDTTYYNDRAVIANDNGASYFHFTEYSNRYYYQTSYNSESSFGSWSAGEHTIIYNDEDGKISFDGTVVGNSNIPDNNSVHYQIGGRGSRTSVQAYYGYIKDCKIYSKSTGTLLYHLRPAEVLGLSCLYEEVTGKLFSNATVEVVDTIT